MVHAFLFYSFFPYHIVTHNRHPATVSLVIVTQSRMYRRTCLLIPVRLPFIFLSALVLLRPWLSWTYSLLSYHVRGAGFPLSESWTPISRPARLGMGLRANGSFYIVNFDEFWVWLSLRARLRLEYQWPSGHLQTNKSLPKNQSFNNCTS